MEAFIPPDKIKHSEDNAEGPAGSGGRISEDATRKYLMRLEKSFTWPGYIPKMDYVAQRVKTMRFTDGYLF